MEQYLINRNIKRERREREREREREIDRDRTSHSKKELNLWEIAHQKKTNKISSISEKSIELAKRATLEEVHFFSHNNIV